MSYIAGDMISFCWWYEVCSIDVSLVSIEYYLRPLMCHIIGDTKFVSIDVSLVSIEYYLQPLMFHIIDDMKYVSIDVLTGVICLIPIDVSLVTCLNWPPSWLTMIHALPTTIEVSFYWRYDVCCHWCVFWFNWCVILMMIWDMFSLMCYLLQIKITSEHWCVIYFGNTRFVCIDVSLI